MDIKKPMVVPTHYRFSKKLDIVLKCYNGKAF